MKRTRLLLVAAVFCSPLWSQTEPDPLDKFAGKTGAFNDTLRGLSATCPSGWTIRAAERWGKEETTIYFKAPNTVAAQPSLYYRVLTTPPPEPDGVKAYLLNEVKTKVELRVRTGMADYTVRKDSLLFRTVNGRPALSFMADFTRAGKKCSEYNTRVLGDKVVSLFFMMGDDWEVEALRPEFDAMIATVKLP